MGRAQPVKWRREIRDQELVGQVTAGDLLGQYARGKFDASLVDCQIDEAEPGGHLRKHYLKDGRFIDGKLYALVR